MLAFSVSVKSILNCKNNEMNQYDKFAAQAYCSDLMNEYIGSHMHLTSLNWFVNSYSSAIRKSVNRRVGHVLEIHKT